MALMARIFSQLFFKTEVSFVENDTKVPSDSYFHDIGVFAYLNHTTLLEPLLFSAFPASFYFKNVKRVVIPGADITLSRPIVGRIYKFVFPQMIPISRKRDHTWKEFMNVVQEDSLVVIAPEGRMKRENGLDKHGKPMTIKGGIADILMEKSCGHLLIGYSGGLHHVQKPGQRKIRFFQTIKMRFEKIDIQEYKASLDSEKVGFKERMIEDLTYRMKKNTPL